MPIISWNDMLNTDVEGIDSQHRVLVGLINKLHDAFMVNKDREVLGGVLRELVNYTVTHFTAEERYMTEHRYPEYETHKQAHAELTAQVLDIQKQFQEGRQAMTMETMRFLKGWLTNHIIDVDRKLGKFLSAQGIK